MRQFHPASGVENSQTRVNRTEVGVQQFPSIAMEPDGGRIVVWGGAGIGDDQGVFARRYDEASLKRLGFPA